MKRVPASAALAPLLACLGLVAIWQIASLMLETESIPSAFDAFRDRHAQLLLRFACFEFLRRKFADLPRRETQETTRSPTTDV